MGHPDKQRRRGSASIANRRAASERHLDGFGSTATRRKSTGFDPFDVSNAEAVNETVDKTAKSSGDPYSVAALEKVMQKKKERGAPRIRRAPQRSASVGALPVNFDDDDDDNDDDDKDKKDEDDLMFDKIDWDNAAPKKSTKGRSRRHSMNAARPQTSKVSSEEFGGADGDFDFDDDPFDTPSSPTKEGDEDDEKKKKKKRSGKQRRQSLDTALLNRNEEEEDGFGPVTTYGFGGEDQSTSAGSANSDRRKNMTRSKSGSGDSMSIASWKSAESETSATKGRSTKAPARGLSRRRSETSMRRSGSSKMVMQEQSYDTETTATADSSLDSP